MTKANHIGLTAQDDKATALATFLKAGRDIVAKSEPNTLQWYALRDESAPDQFAIFDLFPNQEGRQEHFDGDVAAALKDKAPELVKGGWDDGVVANIGNYSVLGSAKSETKAPVARANFIPIKAASGKEAELEQFLVAGATLVGETEPNTLYWYALRNEDRPGHYAIFDLFADEKGRGEHFAGAVAAALEDKAPTLIEGGWDDGVLAHVIHAEVIAAK